MIVAVASQKGGTGKSSTSISLAAGLARLHEKKVLIVDIDSQANTSKVLLPDYQELRKDQTIYTTILDRKPLPVHPTSIPRLSIVPSHILLSNTDVELTTAKDHREARLKQHLDAIRGDYDFVFVDCPPALSWLTINAFTASDAVLVVVSPGYFELDSIVQLNKTVEEVRKFFNPDLKLMGYLFTMSDPTVNSRTSLQVLRQTYTDSVLKTVIPRNTETQKVAIELAMCMEAVDKLSRLWDRSDPEDRKGLAQSLFEYVVYDLDAQRTTDFRLKPWADRFVALRASLYDHDSVAGTEAVEDPGGKAMVSKPLGGTYSRLL